MVCVKTYLCSLRTGSNAENIGGFVGYHEMQQTSDLVFLLISHAGVSYCLLLSKRILDLNVT